VQVPGATYFIAAADNAFFAQPTSATSGVSLFRADGGAFLAGRVTSFLAGDSRKGSSSVGRLRLCARLCAAPTAAFSHTYDILPASNSGTYVVAGRLVDSTLK
jgi:hypothetical protein